MYVPVIRKIINKNNALLERVLPEKGDILVKVGDKVSPFNQLGSCKISYNQLVLPYDFKPLENLNFGKLSSGSTLGKSKREYIHAPYNGFLEKDTSLNRWVYKETGRDYVLLAGAWGVVKNIIPNRSILLEVSVKDFLMPVTCGNWCSGELVVFPNPSELLIGSFLENFTKDVSGKIFYIGGHIGLSTVMKAHSLNLTTLLGGSVSKDAYTFAKSKGINLGIFEGFGEIPTSKIIFDEFKNISNRFVFFDVDKKLFRVPVPEKLETTTLKRPLKQLAVGDTVQIFQSPYFGHIGTVDTIKESSILVKISKNSNLVEVFMPNFFLVL